MWRFNLLFATLIALPALGRCEVVNFTVDPAKIGTLYETGYVDLSSSGLDGTVLTGQSLSLDLVLNHDVLARLFLSDPSMFGIELSISTTVGTFPEFAGPTTGFLLDPTGNKLGGSQVAGRSGSDGSFAFGLDSFTADNLGGETAIDINGVHFDTTFPATGLVVTNAQLRFSLYSPLAGDGVEFGTVQQLPEPPTLGLMLVVVLVIAVMKATGWQSHSVRVFLSETVGKK